MEASGNKAEDEFGDWMSQRPKWLQTAAARLIAATSLPSPSEISTFADLAVAEATKRPETVFEKFPSNVFSSAREAPDFRLTKVDGVVGVNAIRTGAKIDFGRDITVVYGQNGSGKSGFSRLMKHMCGARTKPDLLPDVFSEAPPAPQAEVTIEEGGAASAISWTLNRPGFRGGRLV